MHYVYILRSKKNNQKIYIGSTKDLKSRLKSHNSGANIYSKKFAPWKIIWFCVFTNQFIALKFEKYLKTASGIAFRRKRLVITL